MCVFVGLILLILVWWVGSAAYSGWMGYKWQKQTDAFQDALSKPYREDTYGGKTPEETWVMFLEALKKGDVELASKYVVVEKREKELEFLRKEQEIDDLKLLKEQFAGEFQRESGSGGLEKARFFIPIKNEQNMVEAHSVVFILNPYTKVWKITLL